MSIEPGLYAHLRDDAGIAALLARDDKGALAIYPVGRIPEAAPLPAITYQRVSTVPQRTLQGLAGLTSVRMQITAWAEGDTRASKARAIAAAVIASLSGFRGNWGAVPVSGINFDGMQDMDGDPDSEVGGVDMDFIIWHRGSVP